ncbi:hypothetical protein IQ235_17850, partial [Oscillatoriales cyanobacterium LEGE 11467]
MGIVRSFTIGGLAICWVHLLGFYSIASGQAFTHLSVADGLSQNTVKDISQSREGLLYIGTQEGLNVYDGYEFEVYEHDPQNPYSLADSDISSTYVDRAGTLWVGTISGLHRFDPALQRFERFLLDAERAGVPTLNRITDIVEDEKGRLWLSVDGYPGMGMFDPEGNGQIEYVRDRTGPFDLQAKFYRTTTSLAKDDRGRIWIGTGEGLVLFTLADRTFEHFTYDAKIPPTEVGVNHIRHEASGSTWLSTNYGLYELDRNGRVLQHFRAQSLSKEDNLKSDGTVGSLSYNAVTHTLRDSDGQLWVATRNGLNQYLEAKQRFGRIYHNPLIPSSLGSNDVVHLFEDRTGQLWIGTGQTLDKFSSHSDFKYIGNTGDRHSLLGDVVWSIHRSRRQPDVFWIATKAGLYKYNMETTTQLAHYTHRSNDATSLPVNWIMTIYETQSGILWLGTRFEGAIRFDPATEKFEHFPYIATDEATIGSERVYAIDQDAAGRLWFAGFNGLSHYDAKRNRFVRYGADRGLPELENLKISSLLASGDNLLWIGSIQGLFRLDLSTQSLTKLTHDPQKPESLSGNDILSLHEDSQGQLWVGTSTGLNRWMADDRFERIGGDESSILGKVLSIETDKRGNVWLGKNNGLVRYDPQEKNVKRFHAAQGIQVLEYAIGSSLFDGEQLYLGGVGGLIYFQPDRIDRNADTSAREIEKPRVMLRNLLLDNQPVPISPTPEGREIPTHIHHLDKLRLTHRDLLITLDFAADSYASPL